MKMQRSTEREMQRSAILKDQNVRMTLQNKGFWKDPDKNFLMSLLPALKRLSQRENAEARIKL
jgi:hypothetical protein